MTAKSGILISVLLSLISCASKEQIQHEQKSKQEATALESELHVGMSLEEVKKISTKVSDCRGSEASFMTCQVSFMTHAGRYVPLQQQVGTSDTYETYTLNFEKNQLKRWKKEIENWVH